MHSSSNKALQRMRLRRTAEYRRQLDRGAMYQEGEIEIS